MLDCISAAAATEVFSVAIRGRLLVSVARHKMILLSARDLAFWTGGGWNYSNYIAWW